MQNYQNPPEDTQPNRRRSRTALRSFLMIIIAALILLLALLLLSALVNTTLPDAKTPPTQSDQDATQPPEAPQPAVVPEGSNSENGNATPQSVPETDNQFIAASDSSSGLFGQLGQDALSDFQTCADELEYTARIDDVWDIWDLIFFTIYTNQEIASTSPPACQQLISEYSSSGRVEFFDALGTTWWSGASLPNNTSLSCSTPEECALRQDAEEFLSLDGNSSLIACQNSLFPPSLCEDQLLNPKLACAERYDWTGSLEDLQALVEEDYANSLGDVPAACAIFAGLPFLANDSMQQTQTGIQNGAECAVRGQGCQSIEVLSPNVSLAQPCATDIQWSEAIVDEASALQLVEYLAASAPWLQPGAMPSSCIQLLLSASPTEAGRTYWEFLGKTLSERRIDTAP